MSEKTMRRNVVRILRDAGLDAVAVENLCAAGTPDVNYNNGWVELKHLPRWPIRPGTPVRLRHFTKQQRIWLTRRWYADGTAYLLLQVGQDWLLFPADDRLWEVGDATRAKLREMALYEWRGLSQVREELPKCLLV